MTGQFQDTPEQASVPVIFNQDDTDFIMRPIGEVGYRFTDNVPVVPSPEEGEKLEVLDEATAKFASDCLRHWSGLAQRRIVAHERARELDYEYGRTRLSIQQQANVRADIEKATATIARSTELLGRLGRLMLPATK